MTRRPPFAPRPRRPRRRNRAFLAIAVIASLVGLRRARTTREARSVHVERIATATTPEARDAKPESAALSTGSRPRESNPNGEDNAEQPPLIAVLEPPESTQGAGAVASKAWWLASFPVWLALVLSASTRIWHSTRSYEIHIDETEYSNIAQSIATGHGIRLFGEPFYLHPPAWFLTLGAFEWLTGPHTTTLALVHGLRPVDAVTGAATCALVFALVRRVTGSLVAAMLAGTVIMLDPFSVRWDSRVLLEAPAMMLATAMMYLVVARIGRRSSTKAALIIGIAGGGAILIKETYAFMTALPMLVLLLTGWVQRRRTSAIVVSTMCAVYAAYVGVIVACGQSTAWWKAKTSGISRLVGAHKTTGFNAPGSPSLSSRISAELGLMGPTYVVIAAGSLAAAILCARILKSRSGGVRRRVSRAIELLVIWQACALGYIAYSVLFGSVEEQTFYVAVAPSVILTAIQLKGVTERASRDVGHSGLRLGAVAALTFPLALICWSASVYVDVHTRKDDGYVQLQNWMTRHVPAGRRVAVTDGLGQFVLRGVVLNSGASSIAQAVRERDDYVLVGTTAVKSGYGSARPALAEALQRRARLVFQVRAPTVGALLLYDVTALKADG